MLSRLNTLITKVNATYTANQLLQCRKFATSALEEAKIAYQSREIEDHRVAGKLRVKRQHLTQIHTYVHVTLPAVPFMIMSNFDLIESRFQGSKGGIFCN